MTQRRIPITITIANEQAPETYIHRVGRTGRFGAEGIAVSLISNNQEWRLLQVRACDCVCVERERVCVCVWL